MRLYAVNNWQMTINRAVLAIQRLLTVKCAGGVGEILRCYVDCWGTAPLEQEPIWDGLKGGRTTWVLAAIINSAPLMWRVYPTGSHNWLLTRYPWRLNNYRLFIRYSTDNPKSDYRATYSNQSDMELWRSVRTAALGLKSVTTANWCLAVPCLAWPMNDVNFNVCGTLNTACFDYAASRRSQFDDTLRCKGSGSQNTVPSLVSIDDHCSKQIEAIRYGANMWRRRCHLGNRLAIAVKCRWFLQQFNLNNPVWQKDSNITENCHYGYSSCNRRWNCWCFCH